ncbi:hypothetical protein U1Q18_017793 [Sarracenia purpurea var. burkii]
MADRDARTQSPGIALVDGGLVPHSRETGIYVRADPVCPKSRSGPIRPLSKPPGRNQSFQRTPSRRANFSEAASENQSCREMPPKQRIYWDSTDDDKESRGFQLCCAWSCLISGSVVLFLLPFEGSVDVELPRQLLRSRLRNPKPPRNASQTRGLLGFHRRRQGKSRLPIVVRVVLPHQRLCRHVSAAVWGFFRCGSSRALY